MGDWASYLEKAPLDYLRTLARNLPLELAEGMKDEAWHPEEERRRLKQALLAFFGNPENLDRLWQSLGDAERFFLELILFTSSSSGAEVVRVDERMSRIWGWNTSQEVRRRLLERGLVFIQKGRIFREYYILPSEMETLIYRQKVWNLLEPLRKEEAAEENNGLFLLLDFYVLLAAVWQWEVRVARAGHIYKKDRKRLLALCHSPDEERYELLERLAWGLGFFTEKDEKVTWGRAAWEWVRLPQKDQWLSLNAWLLGPYFEAAPAWIRHLFVFFLHTPRSRWLSVGNLYRLVADYDMAGHWAARDLRDLIRKLVWLGLVEIRGDVDKGAVRLAWPGLVYARTLGEDCGGEELETAFQRLFPETREILVQPDFEIVAPLEVSPAVFFELVRFADLKSADRAFIFRLDARSLYRGFKQGKKPYEVLRFLEEHSKYPLPANVRVSLEEWASRMGQVYLERAVIVRCPAPEMHDEVRVFLEMRGWMEEELAPGVFLIPEDVARRCLLELEACGYFPAQEIRRHYLSAEQRVGGEDGLSTGEDSFPPDEE